MDPGPIFTIDTSSTVTCLLATNHHYLPHHKFNPLLQQTGELDNLTNSLGQSLEFVLCRSPRCLQHLCNVSFLLLVRYPRSPLREDLLLCSSHLALGVSNEVLHVSTINKFSGAVAGDIRTASITPSLPTSFLAPLPGRL